MNTSTKTTIAGERTHEFNPLVSEINGPTKRCRECGKTEALHDKPDYFAGEFSQYSKTATVAVPKTEDSAFDLHMLWDRARKFLGTGPTLKRTFDTNEPDDFPVQPEFMIQTGRFNRNKIIQTPKLVARFPEHNRPCKRQPLKGITLCVEGTGRFNKHQANVDAGYSYAEPVTLKQDDVKAKIRRIRPEEAEELAKIDKTVATIRAALDHALAAQAEALRKAFRKGHVVYVSEVREAAEAKLAERLAHKQAQRQVEAAI